LKKSADYKGEEDRYGKFSLQKPGQTIWRKARAGRRQPGTGAGENLWADRPKRRGQTTLLAAVTAQNPLTSGQVLLGDLPVWENKKALASLCFARELNITSQNPIASLRVREYIETAAAYLPNWDAQMAAKLLAAFELEGKKRLNALSKGMLSMLTITVALASKAPFTFLDEPVAGLDVIARGDFYGCWWRNMPKAGEPLSSPPILLKKRPTYWRKSSSWTAAE
jgi:ABC-type transport system involved in cytochrome c biogenesis ATPase subunit